jgi:hypothetical protein
MEKRSELLAQRIEQGAKALAAFAQEMSEAQWQTVIPPDGRRAGVIIHHVASVYPIEVHLAQEVASGKSIVGITWAAVAQMNAKHAQEHASPAKQETIDLLLRNSCSSAEAVRTFTNEQLDRAAPVSLNADAPLTSQFLIEDHAVRHSWHHLAKIKETIQGIG